MTNEKERLTRHSGTDMELNTSVWDIIDSIDDEVLEIMQDEGVQELARLLNYFWNSVKFLTPEQTEYFVGHMIIQIISEIEHDV